ncbi:MAG: hypothetical protein KatS3mg069_0313 [Meiothermus sp.]|jgi:hypothetical protein|nr:MAG: hypothetical protein KatS3mg069_0313 [Meiothermus sp.]
MTFWIRSLLPWRFTWILGGMKTDAFWIGVGVAYHWVKRLVVR